MVHGAREGDIEAGMASMSGALGLIRAAKADVTAHPELKQELYLSALTSIDNILRSAHLNNPWSTVLPLVQQALIGLEFCAEQLNRSSAETSADEEQLRTLRTELEVLIASVLAGDLEPVLKSLIVRKLEEVRAALVRYHLDGADALRAAFESNVGAIVVAGERFKAATGAKAANEYLDFVTKLGSVVTQLWGYAKLAGPTIRGLLT